LINEISTACTWHGCVIHLDWMCIRLIGQVDGGSIMGGLGVQEMIIILVIALIVFGPKKMPEIGKSLGKGIAEFKKASNDLIKTWEEEAKTVNEKKETPAEQPAIPAQIVDKQNS
jgi:TatA/E family protein of Tat protein translocase